MKIHIYDYDVEIKAKNTLLSSKYNKTDTLNLLNWLSIALQAAADHHKSLKCNAIAKEMEKSSNNLFLICKENGIYKEMKG